MLFLPQAPAPWIGLLGRHVVFFPGAALDQNPHDPRVLQRLRDLHGADSLFGEGVHVGASLDEQVDEGGVAGLRGAVEGGVAVVVRGVDVDPEVEEGPGGVVLALEGGPVEGGPAVLVAGVDGGAGVEEEADGAEVAVAGGGGELVSEAEDVEEAGVGVVECDVVWPLPGPVSDLFVGSLLE